MLVGWLVRKALHEILAHRGEGAAQLFSEHAEQLVQVAIRELGNGELGGNNSGPHVAKYKAIDDPGIGRDLGPWCASFASWCMIEAGLWPSLYGVDLAVWVKKRHGARWLWNWVAKIGSRVHEGARGDLVLFDRGEEGSWKAHVAIVEVREKHWLHIIEGNAGPYPSEVKRTRVDLKKPGRLVGYARLP